VQARTHRRSASVDPGDPSASGFVSPTPQAKTEAQKEKIMKYSNHFPLACLFTLSTGCAIDRQIIVQTPVGPPPFSEARRSFKGELVVYSELELSNSYDIDQQYHSGYKLYSSDGIFLQYVENKIGARFEEPATVSLSPGRYKVVARTAPLGSLSVPVVIEAGKTTMVLLDGTRLSRGRRKTTDSDFVRLPDRTIIGWRAPEENEAQ